MTAREYHAMECPNCHASDQLDVAVNTWARLIGDGEDLFSSQPDWDGNSACKCAACGWEGTAGKARDAFEKTEGFQ